MDEKQQFVQRAPLREPNVIDEACNIFPESAIPTC